MKNGLVALSGAIFIFHFAQLRNYFCFKFSFFFWFLIEISFYIGSACFNLLSLTLTNTHFYLKLNRIKNKWKKQEKNEWNNHSAMKDKQNGMSSKIFQNLNPESNGYLNYKLFLIRNGKFIWDGDLLGVLGRMCVEGVCRVCVGEHLEQQLLLLLLIFILFSSHSTSTDSTDSMIHLPVS